MSLQPRNRMDVPENTLDLMHTIFPKGHPFIDIRAEFGPLFHDEQFAHLYDHQGRPVLSPSMLALVLVLQQMEGLTDRQAADAVRTRIDWTYLLGLDLSDSGFDFPILGDFRQRLVDHHAAQWLFDTMVDAFVQRGLIRAGCKQRSDSTHVVAAIRTLERVELVGETIRNALNHWSIVAPAWVRAEWIDRYADRCDGMRIPKEKTKRVDLAQTIGTDGTHLLHVLDSPDTPAYVQDMPAVHTVRKVWEHQYHRSDGQVYWRATKDLPPSHEQVVSPVDTDARFSKKRHTEWVGYRVHLTETCDDQTPHFITDGQTVVATTPDVAMTDVIPESLASRDIIPAEQYGDAGYRSTDHLESSTHRGIALLGPVNEDTAWQSRSGDGYCMIDFVIDWDHQRATCPQGVSSSQWVERVQTVQIHFDRETCAACPVRAQWTRAKTSGRIRKVQHRAKHELLQHRRAEQRTPAFRTKYQHRAGIEGTISQGIRGCDGRYARYWG